MAYFLFLFRTGFLFYIFLGGGVIFTGDLPEYHFGFSPGGTKGQKRHQSIARTCLSGPHAQGVPLRSGLAEGIAPCSTASLADVSWKEQDSLHITL